VVSDRGQTEEQAIARERLEDRFIVPGRNLTGPCAWPAVFGREGLLDVEIGFGKDEFLLDLAEVRPEGLFLGIDFSRPRSRSYLRKIDLRGLTNVHVLRMHAAAAVGHCLGRGTVREYYVLFPDPWPKKRHASHRLVSPWFAREASRTLAPGGRITLATDHPPYRDQMLDVFEEHKDFVNLRGRRRFGHRPDGFHETIFERRWLSRGKDVFYIQFIREEVS
jgi:tRNA (guanine-N7-)-methyltransferase